MVVDTIPFFVDANPFTRGIVGDIVALAEAMRRAGGTVAWVVPGDDAMTPARVEFLGPEVAELYRTSAGGGAPADRLADPLRAESDDLVVTKSAPSAFFPGRCDLPALLAGRGIDTVIIAGTVASVCCESSARDASTLGYRTIVAADAVSANTDEELNASLHTIYRSFGDVRSTPDLLDLIRAGRSTP